MSGARPRSVNVRFETSFDVRGVTEDVVHEAIATTLKRRGRAPTRVKTPSRQVFLTRSGPWVSFGEVADDDPVFVEWGMALSQELKVDVLEVWVRASNAIFLLVWTAGKAVGRIKLPNDFVFTRPRDPTSITLSTGALSAFRPRRRVIPIPLAMAVEEGTMPAMLRALGKTIGLRSLILEGRIEGIVLGFRALTGS